MAQCVLLTINLFKMNANDILKKHEDANEMHFHELDRKWIIQAMEEYAALCLSAVSHRLLRDLRQTYLVNIDNDGHPKASITEIMDLWDRVNRELQIVTID